MKNAVIFLLITFFSSSVFANDPKLSWDRAVVFAPQSTDPLKITDIKSDKPLPVVIYLHGCTGIVDWHDFDWGKTLSGAGYIVIMPDSMAREGRIANCDSAQKKGGAFPQAHEYRQQEITYALDQIKQAPWADKNRIFLVGHSEGGTAVAISTHTEPRANVILAWTCTFRWEPQLDGIKSPKNIPILAVAASSDEWRVGKPTYGKCIDRAEGRSVQQVNLNGSTHATTKYPESKPAVLEFLKQYQ